MRVGTLLQQHPDLRPLHRELEQLARLRSAVAQCLPANFSADVLTLRAGELVLVADNGSLAAKLRLLTPRILAGLRQRGFEVTGIRLQVQARIRDNSLLQKQISVGSTGCDALESLAARLPASSLRTALKRLAQRR